MTAPDSPSVPVDKKNLQLQDIAPSDLEDVARFIHRVSGSSMSAARAIERLRWIVLENPAREPGDSLGWLLRAPSGEVVGCMCCAPQRFRSNQKIFKLAMSNSFYVAERYRGSGATIFLRYLHLGRSVPLFVSSANATVGEMWQKLGGYSIGNSDHEMFGVVRWSPLLAESVFRKTSSAGLARVIGATTSRLLRARSGLLAETEKGGLTVLGTPGEAARICAEFHNEKITNSREAPFFKWRYFSPVVPSARLFAFRLGQVEERTFMVGVQVQNRGYNQQIRTLQVLDIWGEPDAKAVLAIAGSLLQEYRDEIDAIVFRCLDRACQEALAAHGFKRRSFAAPIAWCIDKGGMLPDKPWYLVPADGDMFL